MRPLLRHIVLSTTFAVVVVVALLAEQPVASATRIHELCDVRGVRSNQLVGFGLVVGLAGTGDRGGARFTLQSTAAMLRRLGATVDPAAIQTKNAAAVIITAELPAQIQPGARIDVTVSSLGNAGSLAGGTLVQTPLKGADQQVYAVAQGALVLGGFSAAGGSGSSVQQNHTTVARVPAGALIERIPSARRLDTDRMVLNLRQPSFVTATRIAAAIEERLGPNTARALDSGTVHIRAPEVFNGNPVGLVAAVQVLDVDPDHPARVVNDGVAGKLGAQDLL